MYIHQCTLTKKGVSVHFQGCPECSVLFACICDTKIVGGHVVTRVSFPNHKVVHSSFLW